MNSSDENELFESSAPSLSLLILHNSLIILITLFGNFLLMGVVIRSNKVKKRKRVTPMQASIQLLLMLNMSLADISFALLSIFPNLLTTLTVPVFYGPNLLCKFVKFLQVIPLYASSFLLVAISADRYNAICRPLDSMRVGVYNRPSLYATLAWTFALIFATPQLLLFYKEGDDCIASYSQPWQYVLYVCMFNTLVWLVPSFLAGSFYFLVCRAVCKSLASKNVYQKKNDVSNENTLQLHHRGERIRSVNVFDRRRVQTVRQTLTIVAANFLLWAPFCLMQVIDAIQPSAISPAFATYILFFGNLNSCVNPWIWFFFNRQLLKFIKGGKKVAGKYSRTEISCSSRPTTAE